jgi:hypothetical protein
MTNEHFEAFEKMWKYITTTSAVETQSESVQAQAVLVLPKNYGFGLRRVDDVIWGYWGPDENSAQVWNVTQVLVSKYGAHLDIVYDDAAFPVAGRYSQIYYWNQTIY